VLKVLGDVRRRSLELVEERCHGIDVLAVRYHLALELDAGVSAQWPLEVGAQHLLALRAVPDAHAHVFNVRHRVTDNRDQYQCGDQEDDFLGRGVHVLGFPVNRTKDLLCITLWTTLNVYLKPVHIGTSFNILLRYSCNFFLS